MSEAKKGTEHLVPRIEFEDIEPKLRELFRPRVERLGYLGEFFRVMSAQPETMFGYFTITESLKKALPDNFTEIVSLSISSRLGNLYEQHQNEQLSRKLGFSDEWIREALEGQGATNLFDDKEKAVQAYAIAAAQRSGRDVEAEFEALVKAVGPEQAIAVVWLVIRTVSHAIISNTLQLASPVKSIFAK
ncbi:MAG: hypothetical protein ACK4NA_11195 [Alphaproteobacteria bacterium]